LAGKEPTTPSLTEKYPPITAEELKILEKEHPQIFEFFTFDDTTLDLPTTKALIERLKEYKDVWMADKTVPINRTTKAEHKIRLKPGSEPFKLNPRKTAYVDDCVTHKHLRSMHHRGIIRRSSSPWASAILLHDKKDGRVRFCVDYRKLNSLTIKDSYPLPRINDVLAKLGGASYYTVMDLSTAFWSIPVKEEDREKTAFTTKYGLWEWCSMPFGLTNAPATQQRFMEAVLSGLLWEFCMVYIDDIVIWSDTPEQHVERIAAVFQKLREGEVYLSPSKCFFAQSEFEILGHVCTKEGVSPNPKKVEAISNFPAPENRKELRRFLGLATWVSRFIRNFSRKTKGLRGLLFEDGAYIWKGDHQRDFDSLRNKLTSKPVLAYPDFNAPFHIHVDSSKVGLGAILTQKYNNKHRVVAYASSAPSQSMLKLAARSATILEAIGVVWAVNHFKEYVHGQEFFLYTDHQALTSTFTSKSSNRILDKLAAMLLEYNMHIIHVPGKKMGAPDAISRAKYDILKYEGEPKYMGLLDIRLTFPGEEESGHDSDDHESHPEFKMELSKLQTTQVIAITPKRPRPDHTLAAILPVKGQNHTKEHVKHSVERRNLEECCKKIPCPTNHSVVVAPMVAVQTRRSKRVAERGLPTQTVKPLEVQEIKALPTTNTLREEETSPPYPLNRLQPLVDVSKMAEEQSMDKWCGVLKERLRNGGLPPAGKLRESILKEEHEYALDTNGALRRFAPLELGHFVWQLVVPEHLEELLLTYMHCDPAAGHMGVRRTYLKMRERFYIPLMATKVKNFVKSCTSCQLSKSGRAFTTTAGYEPLGEEGYPGIVLHLDYTKVHKTPRGNSHILNIIDAFSRFSKLYATSDPNGTDTAYLLMDYVSTFGCPFTIISDNGPEFNNKLVTTLSVLLGTKPVKTLPYNPKGNAVVERPWSTLKAAIRNYISEKQDNWDILLPLLQLALNTSHSRITGFTPYYLQFGRRAKLPLEVHWDVTMDLPKGTHQYVKMMRSNMKRVFQLVGKATKEAREANCKGTKEKLPNHIKVGDIVALRSEGTVKGMNRKLLPK
jgi:hypothetical protein